MHKNSTGARNHFGRQTVRHQGGGHKQRYRLVDFLRNKDGVAGKVERIEYDPNRTAHLALVLYSDGERRYIIAPKGVAAGRHGDVRSGSADQAWQQHAAAPHSDRHDDSLRRDEARQGRSARAQRRWFGAARGARRHVRHDSFAFDRDAQGARRLSRDDRRSVSNDEHNLRSYGKAGAIRWRGIRPTVRGVVMNPVDHPHGGGEGKSGQGNPHPVSPWGWNTKGKKTRRNKRTASMIIRRRN